MNQQQAVKENIDELLKFDGLNNSVIFNNGLTPEHLENYNGKVKSLIDHISELSKVNLDIFSRSQITKLNVPIDKIFELIKTLNDRNFTLAESPEVLNEKILNRIESVEDDVVTAFALPKCIILLNSSHFETIQRQKEKIIQQVESTQDDLKKMKVHLLEEMDDFRASIKEASANAGVTANAEAFATEESNHKKRSIIWLVQTYIFSAAVIGSTFYFLYLSYNYTASTTAEVIQQAIAKVVFLSTLMFVVVWSSKNYKSQKHNQVLNNHRANALKTFQTFYGGTSDQNVKDAILLLAANAAFSNRSTGFESSNEKEAHSSTQATEVFNRTFPTLIKASSESSHHS